MKAIIACDPKGGIGFEGKLPWSSLQCDLPRFKSLTNNNVIVMGRSTWDSLPKKPLPNRLNIVVSSQVLDLPTGAISTNNIDHFKHYKNAWLIGGAKLFDSCWDMIDEIYLSRTYAEYTCDTYIDLVKLKKEFKQLSKVDFSDHCYEIWGR